MPSKIDQRVVHYAAQECSWQQSGELSVAHMVDAWMYAHRRRNKPFTLNHVLSLGHIIEPVKNARGWRTVDVWVGFERKMDPSQVLSTLKSLVKNQPTGDVSADEASKWFFDYENVHPFVDGNGRTGSILYNWLRGSLVEPIHPPNLWDDPRRKYPMYPIPVLNVQYARV